MKRSSDTAGQVTVSLQVSILQNIFQMAPPVVYVPDRLYLLLQGLKLLPILRISTIRLKKGQKHQSSVGSILEVIHGEEDWTWVTTTRGGGGGAGQTVTQ